MGLENDDVIESSILYDDVIGFLADFETHSCGVQSGSEQEP